MMADMMQVPDRTIETKAFSPVPSNINFVGRSVGQFVTLGGTSNSTMDDPVISNTPAPGSPSNRIFPTPPPGSVEAQQVHIARTESLASDLIVRAAAQCKKAVAPKPKG